MDILFFKWAGLCLIVLVTFLLSLFHTALCSSSKISVSRYLEDKNKDFRLRVLRVYEEIKIAVEVWRSIFLIAAIVYLLAVFPRMKLWPLWLFLFTAVLYLVLFDTIPRLLLMLNKKLMIRLSLPSSGIIHSFSTPLLILSRRIEEKEPEEEIRETSDEEIDTFIDGAKEEGIIEKGEDVLLRSVVEFGDTLVREIMTPRVDMASIRNDATIEKLRDLVMKEKYSRIPVYKDRIDNIEGIIIAKDLMAYSENRHKELPIEPLIRPVVFVPESMKVAELLKEFQRKKQKMAVVVDEHGGVSGLVTIEDLVEEIVGEIQDEYDLEESHIVETKPFDYIVSGEVDVEEIEELFGSDLAEDDYITIGGLITHDLGRLPERGETFEIKGLSFEILDVDQKKIVKLRVKKIPAGKEGAGESGGKSK